MHLFTVLVTFLAIVSRVNKHHFEKECSTGANLLQKCPHVLLVISNLNRRFKRPMFQNSGKRANSIMLYALLCGDIEMNPGPDSRSASDAEDIQKEKGNSTTGEANMDKPFEVLIHKANTVELYSKIGSGEHATVRECRINKKSMAACKIVREKQDYDFEVSVMRRTPKHPNLCKMLGNFSPDQDRHCILFPLYKHKDAAGLTLSSAIRKRLDVNFKQILRDVTEALFTLHASGIIHNDLHKRNVVLHKGHAVVIDLGRSQFEGQTKVDPGGSNETQDMFPYVLPSVFEGSEPPSKVSDIYSLGYMYLTVGEAIPGHEYMVDVGEQLMNRPELYTDVQIVEDLIADCLASLSVCESLPLGNVKPLVQIYDLTGEDIPEVANIQQTSRTVKLMHQQEAHTSNSTSSSNSPGLEDMSQQHKDKDSGMEVYSPKKEGGLSDDNATAGFEPIVSVEGSSSASETLHENTKEDDFGRVHAGLPVQYLPQFCFLCKEMKKNLGKHASVHTRLVSGRAEKNRLKKKILVTDKIRRNRLRTNMILPYSSIRNRFIDLSPDCVRHIAQYLTDIGHIVTVSTDDRESYLRDKCKAAAEKRTSKASGSSSGDSVFGTSKTAPAALVHYSPKQDNLVASKDMRRSPHKEIRECLDTPVVQQQFEASVSEQYVLDPQRGRALQGVRGELQSLGAYQRLAVRGQPLLQDFSSWLLQKTDIRRTGFLDQGSKAQIDRICQVLWHMQNSKGLIGEEITREFVAFNRDSIGEFYNRLEGTSLKAESIKNYEKAMVTFFTFLRQHKQVTDEKELAQIKETHKYMKYRARRSSKQLNFEIAEKRRKQFLEAPRNISFKKICQMFETKNVKDALAAIIEKEGSTISSFGINDFIYFRNYLMTRIILSLAQRGQVTTNLTVSDFVSRKRLSKDEGASLDISSIFVVSHHKNVGRGRMHGVPISGDLEALMEFYMRNMRPLVANSDSGDFFFLTKEGNKIQKSVEIVCSFQLQTGQPFSPPVLPSKCRHIIETENFIANSGKDFAKIAFIMNHRCKTAKEVYVDDNVETFIQGLTMLNSLRAEESGDKFSAVKRGRRRWASDASDTSELQGSYRAKKRRVVGFREPSPAVSEASSSTDIPAFHGSTNRKSAIETPSPTGTVEVTVDVLHRGKGSRFSKEFNIAFFKSFPLDLNSKRGFERNRFCNTKYLHVFPDDVSPSDELKIRRKLSDYWYNARTKGRYDFLARKMYSLWEVSKDIQTSKDAVASRNRRSGWNCDMKKVVKDFYKLREGLPRSTSDSAGLLHERGAASGSDAGDEDMSEWVDNDSGSCCRGNIQQDLENIVQQTGQATDTMELEKNTKGTSYKDRTTCSAVPKLPECHFGDSDKQSGNVTPIKVVTSRAEAGIARQEEAVKTAPGRPACHLRHADRRGNSAMSLQANITKPELGKAKQEDTVLTAEKQNRDWVKSTTTVVSNIPSNIRAALEAIREQYEKPLEAPYNDAEMLKRIQKQNWPNIELVRDLNNTGWGVRTRRRFKARQLVCDYRGRWKTAKEFDESQLKRDACRKAKVNSYALDVGALTSNPDMQYIIEAHQHDPSVPTGYGPFINHSRIHPNVEAFFKQYKETDKGQLHKAVVFYTKKAIGAQEKLYWDYGKGFANEWWYDSCWCEKCDGVCYCDTCGRRTRHPVPSSEGESSDTIAEYTQASGPSASQLDTRQAALGVEGFMKYYTFDGRVYTAPTSAAGFLCGVDALYQAMRSIGQKPDVYELYNELVQLSAGTETCNFSYHVVQHYLVRHRIPAVVIDATRKDRVSLGPVNLATSYGIEGSLGSDIVGIVIRESWPTDHYEFLVPPGHPHAQLLRNIIEFTETHTVDELCNIDNQMSEHVGMFVQQQLDADIENKSKDEQIVKRAKSVHQPAKTMMTQKKYFNLYQSMSHLFLTGPTAQSTNQRSRDLRRQITSCISEIADLCKQVRNNMNKQQSGTGQFNFAPSIHRILSSYRAPLRCGRTDEIAPGYESLNFHQIADMLRNSDYGTLVQVITIFNANERSKTDAEQERLKHNMSSCRPTDVFEFHEDEDGPPGPSAQHSHSSSFVYISPTGGLQAPVTQTISDSGRKGCHDSVSEASDVHTCHTSGIDESTETKCGKTRNLFKRPLAKLIRSLSKASLVKSLSRLSLAGIEGDRYSPTEASRESSYCHSPRFLSPALLSMQQTSTTDLSQSFSSLSVTDAVQSGNTVARSKSYASRYVTGMLPESDHENSRARRIKEDETMWNMDIEHDARKKRAYIVEPDVHQSDRSHWLGARSRQRVEQKSSESTLEIENRRRQQEDECRLYSERTLRQWEKEHEKMVEEQEHRRLEEERMRLRETEEQERIRRDESRRRGERNRLEDQCRRKDEEVDKENARKESIQRSLRHQQRSYVEEQSRKFRQHQIDNRISRVRILGACENREKYDMAWSNNRNASNFMPC